MVYVLIQHEITDFEMLKTVYQDDAARRRSLGSQRGHIWRDADDPNNVSVVFEWDTVENARAFASSFELDQAMHWSSAKAPTTRVTVFEEVLESPH